MACTGTIPCQLTRALHLIFCLVSATVCTAQVVLNEVCSRNSTVLEDAYGRHPDWIELHNTGAQPVDLAGHFLSDRINSLSKWALPPLVLPAGGYVVLLSGDIGLGDTYFSFGVSGAGETVYLSDAGLQIVDQLEIPALHADHSYGRMGTGTRVFDAPTPGAQNVGPGYAGYAPAPVLAPPPGIHAAGVQVLITAAGGTTIHYTTNGREPDLTSPVYAQPLQLQESAVVQALSTAADMLPSAAVSGTYLIGIDHELPVLSIAVDPDTMFHVDLGIYMHGPNADTAYPYRGANFWEGNYIPAHLEFFEDGARRISQKIDLRIQGGSSARPKPQRPLRLTARKRYGQEFFEYPFFPERPYNERYKQIVLRNSGGDFCLSNFRDGLFHQIALHNDLDVDVLAYKPVVVYINGAYWGMMNMRERISARNLALAHGLVEEDMLLLEEENIIIQGDTVQFHALAEYIEVNDMNDPLHFAVVEEQLDIQSFIDYFALEMYAGNVDWPSNNIKFWKPSITEGKWRYLLHDLDATMVAAGYIPMDVNMFHWVLVHRAGWMHSEMLRGLLENDEFRRGFINRMADLMNTSFSPGRFQQEVDLITQTIGSEMGPHFGKWEQWVQVWYYHAHDTIPEFARVRPDHVRGHIMEEYDMLSTADIRFDVFPPEGGSLTINTIAPSHPFQGIYFKGNPIDVSIAVADGYTFDHWEYSAEPEYRDGSLAIRKDLAASGSLTAVLKQDGEGLMAWPNPVSDQLNTAFNASAPGTAIFTMYDAQGRLMLEDQRQCNVGTNRIYLDLRTIPAGVYILSVVLHGERQTTRVVRTDVTP